MYSNGSGHFAIATAVAIGFWIGCGIGTDNFSRNAYKSWGASEIFDLLITEASTQLQISTTKSYLRYAVYSSIISSVTSRWF